MCILITLRRVKVLSCGGKETVFYQPIMGMDISHSTNETLLKTLQKSRPEAIPLWNKNFKVACEKQFHGDSD